MANSLQRVPQDDLTYYVLMSFTGLMTDEERTGFRRATLHEKFRDKEPSERDQFINKWAPAPTEIAERIQTDKQGYLDEVRDRILRDHADQVFLNYCPHCGTLARTPQVKQCPRCFHSWREFG